MVFSSHTRIFGSLFTACRPKIKISAFALAIILTTVGVVVTSACVATITSVFSEDAAIKMAHQISHIMMEKTTFRIRAVLERANGIATSAQAGIRIQEYAPMPYQDRAGPASWFAKWRMWAVMLEKSLSTQVHAISFFFEDGSYVSVGAIPFSIKGVTQQVMLTASRLGNNAPPTPPELPLPWVSTQVTLYNYTSMQSLRNFSLPVQMEGFRREGYDNKMPPFSSCYSSVMSIGGFTPTITISYSMYNASNTFLGIGEVMVGLKTFESLVDAQRPTANSEVIILGRYRNIIASSVADTPIGSNQTVPLNYTLSKENIQDGCGLATSLDTTQGSQFLLCLRNPHNLGYTPLRVMQETGLIPAKGAKDIYRDVSRVQLEGLGFYYIAIIDYNQYFHGLDWIAVIIIPEEEVLHDIREGRNIAIGVCVGLAVFVALTNGLLMRLFLRPLAEIVLQMQSAAYLNEEGNSTPNEQSRVSVEYGIDIPHNTSVPLGGEATAAEKKKQKRTKAEEAARLLNSNRTPSYLSDVAAIQHAYWGMVDELGLLRGYIPEHLRDQLLETHRQNSAKNSELSAASEASGTLDGKQKSRKDEMFSSLQVSCKEGEGGPDCQLGFSPKGSVNELAVSTSTGQNVSGSNGTHSGEQKSDDINPSRQGFQSTSLNNDTSIFGCNIDTTEVEMQDFAAPDTHIKDSFDSLNLPTLSAKASTRQAARFASLGNLTDNNDPKALLHTFDPLPLFAENGLVERNITVALINITGFHHYVFTTGTGKVVKEHEQFVSYVHEVAKRCGGVLDNFNGDKFWVSFNASTPCDEIYVAATLFAHEVATTVNREASLYQQYLDKDQQRSADLPPLSPQRPRFPVALRGVTIGVATGRAFVGPLGTKKIRRHTITSNAISEASALERMAARYPDCGVMVGGDMIPAIEGYFQYLLLDATGLPGSGGLRRRIASIKGVMTASNRENIAPFLIHTALKMANPLPSTNPFDSMNSCFNAFLEGRIPEVVQRLGEINNYVELSRQVHRTNSPFRNLPDGRSILTQNECTNILLMVQFISSIGQGIDGRQYRSPFDLQF